MYPVECSQTIRELILKDAFFTSSNKFFLIAQNLNLFGKKLQHFLKDAFKSYYDLF